MEVKKQVGRPKKPKKELELTIIEGDKIHSKCSTKTYIVKVSDKMTIPLQKLLEKIPCSKETKFRNCVIFKRGKLSIKMYTNLTLQITGAISLSEIIDVINDLPDFNVTEFCVYCAMGNWTVCLQKNVDLFTTMDNANKNGLVSYFLRGYPLITKIPIKYELRTFFFRKNCLRFNLDRSTTSTVSKQVSILMFKSGNSIVSGPSEQACAKACSMLKPLLA